jgi:hypothetical protein
MAGLASINIRFRADLSGFSSEMQNVGRQMEATGKKMQSIGRGMSTYLTLPVLAAGAAAIKMASDYDESMNKVEVAFKGSSFQVREFAKTTLESFGIAEGTALDMAAAYGDMGTSMGLTNGEAAKMSTSLVGLAGDLASFKNISIDVANTALASIFTGETESLKKMGIVMTVVNLQNFALQSGIKKTYEAMSQAEKVNLRYNYILSVTKNAQGDFTRTQGGAANQSRIFTESLKQLGQQLGSVILPLFTKIITAINGKVKAFLDLSDATKTTIVVVAGLVAVVGPLLIVIGSIVAIIPTLVAGFAVLSGAILPILAGVVLLYGAYLILGTNADSAAKATVKLSDSQKTIGKITDEATSSIVAQKSALELLLLTAKNENESKAARVAAIKEINRISPEYLGNLTLENIGTDKARVSIEKYNAALLSGATARAASVLLEKNQADKIQAGFAREKALAEYNAKRQTAIAKGWEAEKQFYEDNNRTMQFANEELDRKNAKYDAEAKLLIDIYGKNKQNLDLVKETAGATDAVTDATAKLGKAIPKAGTIAFYEAQIAALQKIQQEATTTEAAYYGIGNSIDAIQVKIDAIAQKKFEPISIGEGLVVGVDTLATSVETTETMMGRLAAAVRGAKASLQTDLIDLSGIMSDQFEALAENAAIGFGEMLGSVVAGTASLSDLFKGMLGIVGSFLTSLGKSLIQVGIASAAFKKAFANPFVAIAAGVALVVLGSVVQSKLSQGPGGDTQKFAEGGIVGGSSFYGDKVLARVNSGELILNQNQQKKLHGMLGSGGSNVNVTLGGGFEIDGSKLRLVLDRTEKRKNRLS